MHAHARGDAGAHPRGLAFHARPSGRAGGRRASPDALIRLWDALRERLSAHRRFVAAGFAGLAVLLAWPALGGRYSGSEVLVAAHDLPPGTPLADRDVRAARLPDDVIPAHALRPGTVVSGRAPAGPVRAGEPLTDVRLLGPALLDELSRQEGRALVAAAARIGDGAAAGLLRAGDTIDILAAGPALDDAAAVPGAAGQSAGTAGPARLVGAGVRVLAVPPAEGTDPSAGALVVVGVPPATAADIASAAGTSRLSVSVRGSSDALSPGPAAAPNPPNPPDPPNP